MTKQCRQWAMQQNWYVSSDSKNVWVSMNNNVLRFKSAKELRKWADEQ